MSRLAKMLQSPRRVQAVIFAATALPTLALVWFGWSWFVLERDRQDRQLDEERKRIARLVAASLRQSMASDAQRLTDPSSWNDLTADDAHIVVIQPGRGDGFEIHPKSPVAFYPYRESLPEAPDSAFRSGEEAERRLKDYPRAIAIYRPLARSTDSTIRAGAKLRLARSLRLAGQRTEAADVYRELSRESAVEIGLPGVPADLEARRLRCAMLEQLHRTGELRIEAEALLRDLRLPRWRLDRVNYELYTRQAASWLEPSSVRSRCVPRTAARAHTHADHHADGQITGIRSGPRPGTGRRRLRNAKP